MQNHFEIDSRPCAARAATHSTTLALGLASLFIASGLGGCVSTGRYDDLKKRYDAAQASLVGSRTEEHRLGQVVAERDGTIWGLKAKLRQEQSQRAEVEMRYEGIASDNEILFAELQALADDRSQLQKMRDRLKESLVAVTERKADAERRANELRGLLDRWKSLIDAGTLSVSITDGRIVLVLPSDVLFDSGSAKLNQDGKAAVQQVGAALATMTGRRFQVEGHTDNVPISNAQFPSNWELASARALGVVRSMLAAGMQSSQLSAASYGEFRPVMTNDSPQGRAENRRIEIVLLPDLSKAPEVEQPEPVAER